MTQHDFDTHMTDLPKCPLCGEKLCRGRGRAIDAARCINENCSLINIWITAAELRKLAGETRPDTEALREALERLVAWAEKYPAGRTYPFYMAQGIEAELVSVTDAARAALASTPARDVQPEPPDTRRPCTCVGSCRGAEGLGKNWRCVVESARAYERRIEAEGPSVPPSAAPPAPPKSCGHDYDCYCVETGAAPLRREPPANEIATALAHLLETPMPTRAVEPIRAAIRSLTVASSPIPAVAEEGTWSCNNFAAVRNRFEHMLARGAGADEIARLVMSAYHGGLRAPVEEGDDRLRLATLEAWLDGLARLRVDRIDTKATAVRILTDLRDGAVNLRTGVQPSAPTGMERPQPGRACSAHGVRDCFECCVFGVPHSEQESET